MERKHSSYYSREITIDSVIVQFLLVLVRLTSWSRVVKWTVRGKTADLEAVHLYPKVWLLLCTKTGHCIACQIGHINNQNFPDVTAWKKVVWYIYEKQPTCKMSNLWFMRCFRIKDPRLEFNMYWSKLSILYLSFTWNRFLFRYKWLYTKGTKRTNKLD